MNKLLKVALAGIFATSVSIAHAQTAAPATPPKAAAPAPAPAAPAKTAANPQQERMKSCNDKAKDMKGDERKTYMSSCLAGKEPEKKLTAQQQRMKDCNAKATGMAGDARKKFMSECLKA
ncbi:MAG TPA: PsiF family protein [Casimicrobiaceae bacterium]|nr:PsiF family protein [Casimicrobiaceae bacterium]